MLFQLYKLANNTDLAYNFHKVLFSFSRLIRFISLKPMIASELIQASKTSLKYIISFRFTLANSLPRFFILS